MPDFKFVPAKVKTKSVRVTGKLVKGYCIIDADGTFKVHVSIDGDSDLLLPFTEDSFECAGRPIVFDKTPTKGVKTMYIRKDRELALYPGTNVSPVAEGRTFSGYIIKKGFKLYFKLHDYIGYGDRTKTSEETK